MQFIFGQMDSELWDREYKDTLANFGNTTTALRPSHNNAAPKIKKISMVDCNKTAAILTTEEMMDYLRLIGKSILILRIRFFL